MSLYRFTNLAKLKKSLTQTNLCIYLGILCLSAASLLAYRGHLMPVDTAPSSLPSVFLILGCGCLIGSILLSKMDGR